MLCRRILLGLLVSCSACNFVYTLVSGAIRSMLVLLQARTVPLMMLRVTRGIMVPTLVTRRWVVPVFRPLTIYVARRMSRCVRLTVRCEWVTYLCIIFRVVSGWRKVICLRVWLYTTLRVCLVTLTVCT